MGKSRKRRHSSSSEDDTESRLRRRIKRLEEKLFKRKRPNRSASPVNSQEAQTTSHSRHRPFEEGDIHSMDCAESHSVLSETELSPQRGELQVLESDTQAEAGTLEEAVLAILGVDPSTKPQSGDAIHQDLASRWTIWLHQGLQLTTKNELLAKYLVANNCSSLKAPELNPEIIASITEATIKRDSHFVKCQNQLGAALTALGTALSMLLKDSSGLVDRLKLIELLSDSGKLLTDIHFIQSKARRAYITPTIKVTQRPTVESAVIDQYLYGADLSERLRDAKAIEKSSSDLKLAKPSGSKSVRSNPLNWQTPPASSAASHPRLVGNQRPQTTNPRDKLYRPQYKYKQTARNPQQSTQSKYRQRRQQCCSQVNEPCPFGRAPSLSQVFAVGLHFTV